MRDWCNREKREKKNLKGRKKEREQGWDGEDNVLLYKERKRKSQPEILTHGWIERELDE
jgi:hypothetical protein